MPREHFQTLIVCLVVLAMAALGLVGITGGCSKSGVKDTENGGIIDGEVENGADDAAVFSGIALVRDGRVYLAVEDGSEERELTSGAAGYGDLAFSPSGGKLAATRIEGDAMPQLVVIDVASGKVTDVSWTNPDYSIAWTQAGVEPWFGGISWAGEDVLYCTGIINQGDRMILQVLEYDLSAHRIEVIEGDAQNPAVSPDGGTLAYIRKPDDWDLGQLRDWEAGDFGDLAVRDLASGDTRVVSFSVLDAAFSPRGDHMALTVCEEPDTSLIVTDLDARRQNTLRVIGPSGTIRCPSFSPEGDRLVACRGWREASEEQSSYTVFTVPADQDNAEVNDLGEGEDPTWSPLR